MQVEFAEFKAKYPTIASVWEKMHGPEFIDSGVPEDFLYSIVPTMDQAEEYAKGIEDLTPWAEDEQDDILGRIIMALGTGLAVYKR